MTWGSRSHDSEGIPVSRAKIIPLISQFLRKSKYFVYFICNFPINYRNFSQRLFKLIYIYASKERVHVLAVKNNINALTVLALDSCTLDLSKFST